MDSITQAALGAALGEAVLGRRLGNRALVWGAVLGTLPDLDVLFSPFLDTAQRLAFHRGASHSLLFMLLASVVLAPWLARLWRKQGVSVRRAGVFVFSVWSTHVLLDCFTVYGTSVFWPFSDYRVGFNNLFIIDPFYTGVLLVSLVWIAFLRKPENQRMRRALCGWGLGVSSAYVVLSVVMKLAVSVQFDADLQRRGMVYHRRMEAPAPLNIFLWRSVVDCGDELWVGYRSIFDSNATPIEWVVYPRNRAAMEPFADNREVQVVDWFSEGWWIARPHPQGVWIADLRFGESRRWDTQAGMVDQSLAFSWVFHPSEEGDRLRQVLSVDYSIAEVLERLFARILGHQEGWESGPRLVGIGDGPSEPLRVVR